MTADAIYLATIWIIPGLIAITFHEAAHGFVAHLLGDDTAWRLGRVSFNPLKHVDPVGTILLPGILLLMRSPFLFGYAKPEPPPGHVGARSRAPNVEYLAPLARVCVCAIPPSRRNVEKLLDIMRNSIASKVREEYRRKLEDAERRVKQLEGQVAQLNRERDATHGTIHDVNAHKDGEIKEPRIETRVLQKRKQEFLGSSHSCSPQRMASASSTLGLAPVGKSSSE
jgi:hypothetical protein